jgi:hypothetical protein
VIGGIGEYRAGSRRRKDVSGKYRSQWVLGTDETEQVSRIDRWISDRSRSINMIRHVDVLFLT